MIIDFDSRFAQRYVSVDGLPLFYQSAGSFNGPLVLLFHGHTQSSDMWAPLANTLLQAEFSVLAFDLHGLGRSEGRPGRYEKKKMAADFHKAIQHLGHGHLITHIVGHDLGVFVAYAYASQFAQDVFTLTMMDATLPGVGIWSELLQQSATWHFGFFGKHAERIIRGRERQYLERFWEEFSFSPSAISESYRKLYTSFYQSSGAIGRALSHFEAFETDALDIRAMTSKRLQIPVFGLGGQYSLGHLMESHLQLIAKDYSCRTVPGAGHWLIEENPDQTIGLIQDFLLSHA